MSSIFPPKYIVLYDGDCGFCNFWVMWLVRRDKNDNFRFASLQSGIAEKIRTWQHAGSIASDSIYLVENRHSIYNKSSAIIKMFKVLGGVYQLGTILKLFPVFVRDAVYDYIAGKRKSILKNRCMIPSAAQQKKFLTELDDIDAIIQ